MGIESLGNSIKIIPAQTKAKTEANKDAVLNIENPKQLTKEKFKALALGNDNQSTLMSKLKEINPKKDFALLFEKSGEITLNKDQLSNLKMKIKLAGNH